MGKYRSLGSMFNRVFRNDLNANFDSIEMDLTTQKSRVDNLIKGTTQPSELIDARNDVLGKNSVNLKERLDKEQLKLSRKFVTLSDFNKVEDAIAYAKNNSFSTLFLDIAEISIHNVDFKGLNIVGDNTSITGSPKNVRSAKGVVIRGVDQNETQLGEFGNMSGTVSTKIVHKISENEYRVYSKKPFTNEYLDFRFEKGVFSTTSSAAAPADLLRLTGVFNITSAYAQNHTPSAQQGTWESYERNLGSAAGIPNARNIPVKFYRNITSETNSWIEFEAYANENGEISLGLFCSPASSSSIPVKVNGTLVDTINGVGVSDFVLRKIKCNQRGNVTIRIEKTSAGHVYVTSNLYRLHEAPTEATYTNVAIFDDGNSYISNKGAADYAMADANGLYWGSYHGGESFVSGAFLADKTSIAGLSAVGKMFPCRSFRIDQTTTIGSYFQSRTSMRINRDGFFDFDFSLTGSATLQTIYTTMTTSDTTFNYVTYPKLTSTTSDGEYYFGKTNRITQENTTTRQKITTLFTRYENENNANGGVFVRTTQGAYCKVYYGPVVSGLRTINELYGSNTRIFE